MSLLHITVGPLAFTARLELERAPTTCAAFLSLLPFHSRIIHARWSGEACWIPLGAMQLGVGFENHTSHPSRGDLLFHPGGLSETEILFAYGSACFASKVGQLAGNHFLTIVDGRDQLDALGHLVLWDGAQPIAFDRA